MDDVVFTIGHSTHTAELHQITAVADVRLQPYSRMNPQFNRETLREMLRESHMAYVFLGKELGARSEDRTCYLDGKVQYGRLSQTELFRRGLDRVREGTRSFRVALMCAEKEPLECHRTILVARHLEPLRIEIRHILADAFVPLYVELPLVYRMQASPRAPANHPNRPCVSSSSKTTHRSYDSRSDARAERQRASGF